MNRKLFYIFLIFSIIYGLISFVNHYVFRTYTLDLGAYTNALYDYRNFQFNDSLTFKSIPENLLSDHFDLYLPILSPLSFIFGTYTLLIIQIVSILFGALGINKVILLSSKNSKLAIQSSIYFLTFFGVFSALAFDYHSNVVSACLVPWLIYFSLKKKTVLALLIFTAVIIGKENMSLWTFFIGLGLLWANLKDIYYLKLFSFISVSSIIYFVAITSYIMPALSNNGTYPHFDYSALGSSSSEAIIHLISQPIDSIKIMFTNHNNSEFGDFVKIELLLLLCVAGLPILLRKPQYLLMLIPIFIQKLFHDNYSMWGINAQYCIEFAPILAIGIFLTASKIKSTKYRNILVYSILVLNLAATIRIMDNTVFYTNKSQIRFYKKDHYSRDFDVSKAYKTIGKIPNDAVVSSQSIFLPHLSLRDKIYQFPNILDAEYIVYAESEGAYPLTDIEFKERIDFLLKSNKWENISDNTEVTLLKKL